MSNLATPVAPGVYVTSAAAAGNASAAVRTGTFFVTGECAQGPTGQAIPITSMADFGAYCGPRASYGFLYDTLDEYFRDGGLLAYVSRVVGPTAAPATVMLNDTAASPLPTLAITASGPGAYGSALSVVVAAGPLVPVRAILATLASTTAFVDPAGSLTAADVGRTLAATGIPANTTIVSVTNATTAVMSVAATATTTGVAVIVSAPTYTLGVYQSGVLVAQSGPLQSPTDAVNWAATTAPWSFPVVIANQGSVTPTPKNNPATGTFYLSGGLDDLADVVEAQWTAALTAFNTGLAAGLPGQVSAPGHTTAVGWGALIAHAAAYNRYALCDDTDSATAANVVANAQTAQAQATIATSPYGAMFGPWVQIPGVAQSFVGGSPAAPMRTIPPCGLVAALCARNDQVNDANNAPAGSNGQSVYATGVSQTYVPTDLATVNAGCVSIIRVINGVVTLYGNVSLSTDPNWTVFANGRMRMQITDDLGQIGQQFVFGEIDGQGHFLASFAGAISGKMQQYWQRGSIFGPTVNDAFVVNVGSAVNTPVTEAQGEVIGQVGVRFSPSANIVWIPISKYSITAPLPSAGQALAGV
jgi:hypothetical protein